jgi:hypothetical protein
VTNGVTTRGPAKAPANDRRRRPLSTRERQYLDRVVAAVLTPPEARIDALEAVLSKGPPHLVILLERAIFQVATYHRLAQSKRQADFEELELRLGALGLQSLAWIAEKTIESLLRGHDSHREPPELAIILRACLLLADRSDPVRAWGQVREGIVIIVDWELQSRTRDGYADDYLEDDLKAEGLVKDLGLSPEPSNRADRWELRRFREQ